MRKNSLLFLFIFSCHCISAQQTTSSGSGKGIAGNITLDWNIGELTLVNTVRSGGFVLTQGVLQGRLTAPVASSDISSGELIIFPNPTLGMLSLQTAFFEPGQLTYVLYDINGRILLRGNNPVGNIDTRTIDVTHYPGSVYMLRAVFTNAAGKIRSKTYKIVKL